MNDDKAKSRRERHALLMRHQIADAAADLFIRKGFHNTTTKDIARAADVSEGSIYNYFENKEDILYGIIEFVAEEELQKLRLDESLSDDPSDYLLSRLLYQKEKIIKRNPVIQIILLEIIFNMNLRKRYASKLFIPMIEQVANHLKTRIELGQIRDVPPKHLSRIFLSILFGFYFLDMLDDDITKNQWEELSRTTINIIFEGIKTEP